MSDTSDAFLGKARESLAGATSEFANGRYNNAANRSYYACFQAAIAALELAGVRPPAGREQWGHSFVQAQFAGVLITRRKRYPAELRDVLTRTYTLRQAADYTGDQVSEVQAARGLRRTEVFVSAVQRAGQETGGTPS